LANQPVQRLLFVDESGANTKITRLRGRVLRGQRLVDRIPHGNYQTSTLDRLHDESQYRLPMPARYAVDKQGIIRAADVNADYTIRPEPSETLS
jgi:hypothetical protein